MENNPPPLQKSGIGVLGWLGIGCGGIIVLAVVAVVFFGAMFGGKIKQFAEDVQKDPTRTMATTMVSMSAGQFEMVAEDAAGKRYTVREKANGKLTTLYWDEKKQKVEVIPGDFSAIPGDAAPATESAPVPATEPSAAPAAPAAAAAESIGAKTSRAIGDSLPAPERK